MRRLPPLNGLRAFEAAARHLSFARAAEELGVTPAAISQQVRALEAHAGVRLFRRRTRSVLLTEAAQAALPAITAGLDRLAEGYTTLRKHEESGLITVSAAPSFASKWLMPRIGAFHAAHPEFELRIDATERVADLQREDVDLAIRYGGGEYEGLDSACLIEEAAFPVCAPALRDGTPPLRAPADLAHHTLLHVHWTMQHESLPNWRMWLRAAGLAHIDAERGPRFSIDSLALQTAIDGHGVALALAPLVEADLAAGRLVAPFGVPAAEARRFRYYMVWPASEGGRRKIAVFRDWVLAEAAAPG